MTDSRAEAGKIQDKPGKIKISLEHPVTEGKVLKD